MPCEGRGLGGRCPVRGGAWRAGPWWAVPREGRGLAGGTRRRWVPTGLGEAEGGLRRAHAAALLEGHPLLRSNRVIRGRWRKWNPSTARTAYGLARLWPEEKHRTTSPCGNK